MTHVLLISRELIPSVRLCGYEQYKRMEQLGWIEFRYSNAKDLTPELAGWADVIQFVRPDSAVEVLCAKEWKKAGKHLIFVLDDDLFEVPDGFGSSNYYHRENVQQNMRNMMAECHTLLSPSAYLRQKYGKDFETVGMIEEPALYETPPTPQRQSDGRIRIGFAGSIDRAQDIDMILREALEKILTEYGDRVSVEFFGAKPTLAEHLSLRHIPYCDSYEDYRQTMRQLNWDIGLAPMPDTAFHQGKHYNKFIEYAANGIVGIYSNVIPYSPAVEHEISGLLCENTASDWYAAIRRLIDEPALLASMRQKAVDLACTRFSLESVTEALKNELGEILTLETDRSPLRFTKKLKRIDLSERLRAGIKQDGFFRFFAKKVYSRVFARKKKS